MEELNLFRTHLEPCPHCGNPKPHGRRYQGRDGFRDRFSVLCDYAEGGCGAESGHYHTIAEAVTNWNCRHGVSTPKTVQLKFRDEIKPIVTSIDSVDWSGWESPINLAVNELSIKVMQELDNSQEKLVLEACQQANIDVDREQLLLALRYDRKQFEAGWTAGYNRARSQDLWFNPKNQAPDEGDLVLIYTDTDEFHLATYQSDLDVYDCDYYCIDSNNVLRWMPCLRPEIDD